MNDGREYTVGFLSSIIGHIGLFFLLSFVAGGWSDFGKPIVYSVSIESGERVGGISQAPKDPEKKSIPTPAVKEQPKEKKQEEPPQEKDEDAEVVLPEEKATPKPTPKPKPKATPKPTPKPKPKATPKPKPTPKKPPKPKPKPKPTPKKKASIDDIDKALERAVKKYTGESTDAGGEGYGSTGTGGSGFGGGTTRPPEFFRYQSTLEGYVKRGWRWHDSSAPLRASVCFRIAADGVLSDVTLCASSGDEKFDSSVVRAIQKANPVPPPPPKVYEFFQRVRITFTPQTF